MLVILNELSDPDVAELALGRTGEGACAHVSPSTGSRRPSRPRLGG